MSSDYLVMACFCCDLQVLLQKSVFLLILIWVALRQIPQFYHLYCHLIKWAQENPPPKTLLLLWLKAYPLYPQNYWRRYNGGNTLTWHCFSMTPSQMSWLDTSLQIRSWFSNQLNSYRGKRNPLRTSSHGSRCFLYTQRHSGVLVRSLMSSQLVYGHTNI